jgi:hypothetical protein
MRPDLKNVIAGLDPAIHKAPRTSEVFGGCPGQARA